SLATCPHRPAYISGYIAYIPPRHHRHLAASPRHLRASLRRALASLHIPAPNPRFDLPSPPIKDTRCCLRLGSRAPHLHLLWREDAHPRGRRGGAVSLAPAEEGKAEEAGFAVCEGWGRGLVGVGVRGGGFGEVGLRVMGGVGC